MSIHQLNLRLFCFSHQPELTKNWNDFWQKIRASSWTTSATPSRRSTVDQRRICRCRTLSTLTSASTSATTSRESFVRQPSKCLTMKTRFTISFIRPSLGKASPDQMSLSLSSQVMSSIKSKTANRLLSICSFWFLENKLIHQKP